jgi:hypothetical protein
MKITSETRLCDFKKISYDASGEAQVKKGDYKIVVVADKVYRFINEYEEGDGLVSNLVEYVGPFQKDFDLEWLGRASILNCDGFLLWEY